MALTTRGGLSWTHDGFGNRLQQSTTKGSAPVHSVAADGVYEYGCSSANRRIRVTSATAVFAWLYGFEGEMLAVYKLEKEIGDAGKTWPVLQTAREGVYALSRLNRMGTSGVLVDRSASVIRHGSSNLAYYPCGEEQGGASANDRAKFATYTRDSSTGLDYAWNRMHKTEWGRFTSADPLAGSGTTARPASWNRYSYVSGDPVNSTDSTGRSPDRVVAISRDEKGEPTTSMSCPVMLHTVWPFYWGTPSLGKAELTRAATGIGTNSGDSPTKVLLNAAKAALNALEDDARPGLFNPDVNRPHTHGLGVVLQTIVLGMTLNGTYLGSVKPGPISLNFAAVTVPPNATSTGPSQEGRALSSDIVLQSNRLGAGYYMKQSVSDLSRTILHELGHVFNSATGLGRASYCLRCQS